jgi:hypothetical protein
MRYCQEESMFRVIFMCLWCASAFAFQTDSVFPWVTNNQNFSGLMVINNLSGDPVDVTLNAVRGDGTSEMITLSLDPFGQMVDTAANLFTELGEGAGYTVYLNSDSDLIKGAFVISGLGSASGNSPAQADVLPLDSAGNVILFNYMPIGDGFSAPGVVNTGDADATVRLIAYQNGITQAQQEVTIPAGRPFADVTSNLFPGLTGDVYVVAESDQPVLGMAFLFNDALEPSMAAAAPIDAVPDAPVDNTPTDIVDVDTFNGAGSSYQLLVDEIDAFNAIGIDSGIYIVHPDFGLLDWVLIQIQLTTFIDGNDTDNSEVRRVILDYTKTEEVLFTDPGAGEPVGTGVPVGGVIEIVTGQVGIDDFSLFLNVPTAEGMAAVQAFFQLPPR